MANRIRFLLAVALAAAWPCAAEDLRAKRVGPVSEVTGWLQQDGIVVRTPGRKELVILPDWTWAGESHACPPALAVGPLGEILVTSNVLASLWKIDPHTLNVTVHPLELDSDRDKDVGFSTLRYSPDEGAWLAFSAVHGTTWRIDAALTQGQRIASNPEWRTTCATH